MPIHDKIAQLEKLDEGAAHIQQDGLFGHLSAQMQTCYLSHSNLGRLLDKIIKALALATSQSKFFLEVYFLF